MKIAHAIVVAAACVAAPAAAFAAPLPTPVLAYNFDEAGTVANSTGSASTNGTPVLNITGTGAARGGAGSGVSGTPSDLAFDNTNSSGIFGGGRAQAPGVFAPIDNLTAFTLTGWFFLPASSQPIGAQAGLIDNIDYQASSSQQGGFGLTGATGGGSGALRLRVNEVTGVESPAGTYAEVGQYVNFAVTYDGSTANFYKGLVNQPESLVGSVAYAKGAAVDVDQPLVLGSNEGGSSLTFSQFNGLIDDVGIYNQVLSLPDLESLRSSNVGAVPEPASLSLLTVAAAGLLGRRRRALRA